MARFFRIAALLHHSRRADLCPTSAEVCVQPPARNRRFWRGAAAPLAVCAGALYLAQGLGPVSAQSVTRVSAELPKPSREPAPVAADPRTAPDGDASAELFVRLQDRDTLDKLLVRAGVPTNEAATAARLVAGALPAGIAPGTEVAVLLGEAPRPGHHMLQRVTLRTGLELKLVVARDGSGSLGLQREDIAVDSSPLRFTGRAGSSLYWSLRAAGVPPQVASDYLGLLSGRIDLARELRPDDRFDLIFAHRRATTGESETGPLLYAAVDRRSGADVQLVKWRSGWFDANSGAAQPSGLAWPVPGRVTSAFGARVHPILRFVRFHRGVDLRAPWGTPIVGAADGRVASAGWNGGHGRQVRIAHGSGLETSYSHMSHIAADPGNLVRRGQLIGYVGSTGFSTGPHLHYEVHEHGRPVDPQRTRHSATAALSRTEVAAIRARLRQLLAVDA